MPRRFQFSLKTLLWLMLAAAFFFAGVQFERERKSRRGNPTRFLGKPVYTQPLPPPQRPDAPGQENAPKKRGPFRLTAI